MHCLITHIHEPLIQEATKCLEMYLFYPKNTSQHKSSLLSVIIYVQASSARSLDIFYWFIFTGQTSKNEHRTTRPFPDGWPQKSGPWPFKNPTLNLGNFGLFIRCRLLSAYSKFPPSWTLFYNFELWCHGKCWHSSHLCQYKISINVIKVSNWLHRWQRRYLVHQLLLWFEVYTSWICKWNSYMHSLC